ncbi:MAG TPA: aspartyl protease family protein [Kofleriaceae bacterium]|nr:aspartyl protease family protein [Kofleriaceae bacterium]
MRATAAVFLVACTSSPAVHAPSRDQLTRFAHVENVIPVVVKVGDDTGLAIVDTGNPLSDLDQSKFASVAALPLDGGTVASLQLDGSTSPDVYVVGSPFTDLTADPTFPIVGNMGCSAFCAGVPSFDYRDGTFALDATPPTGLGADIAIPFSFEGGNIDNFGQRVTSRVIVTVELEGHAYQMMLDTGATSVSVSERAFAALTADGRTTIAGQTAIVSGASTSTLTRAASITLAGVEVDDAVVIHDSGFDTVLTAISNDVGHTIDGSLGGTFLNHFYVTVDYANRIVHLAPYDDVSFVLDQGHTIGLSLTTDAAGQLVIASVAGDAAAKGLHVGDVVQAIDGIDASAGYYALAEATYGPLGATKTVELADTSATLAVDELLPL